ncbi:hypothetical protein MSIMFB_05542 [Mycobacterium simulans]|uniref:Uncharacterized protein n=1 Tax=Mycobacterium simulans TaxID=627089 RepID=A0A7Z7IRU7_9MYCO|nr:hypothetical protein MSIMFB_05542 [Mycobacterium simulans]
MCVPGGIGPAFASRIPAHGPGFTVKQRAAQGASVRALLSSPATYRQYIQSAIAGR